VQVRIEFKESGVNAPSPHQSAPGRAQSPNISPSIKLPVAAKTYGCYFLRIFAFQYETAASRSG